MTGNTVRFHKLWRVTRKVEDLAQVASPAGVNFELLDKKLPLFSVSERSMIRFALQLFDPEQGDIMPLEVFQNLDEKNERVVLEAIRLRYKIQD